MTTIIMRTSEGDMRMMLLLWDATPGNRSLKIVEILIKTTLNNPDFPEKKNPRGRRVAPYSKSPA